MRKVIAVGMIIFSLLTVLYVLNVWFVDGSALRAAYDAGEISGRGVDAGLNDMFFRMGCWGIPGIIALAWGVRNLLKRN